MISNSWQWNVIWPDGDFWIAGIMTQALYLSPDKNLVIPFYLTNEPDDAFQRYQRPIATSGLFD